jgi:prepilin-type N-terminal cleavage/methylation domain-containing protein
MSIRRPRRGLTLIELLVVIGIVTVLLGLTLAAVQQARAAAARAQCLSNLWQIGLGLHGFHDVNNAFPPGVSSGRGPDPYRYLNWHSRILPFVEQPGLWAEAEAAYKADPNRPLWADPPHPPLSAVVKLYACPADGRTTAPARDRYGNLAAFTDYLGVRGGVGIRKDGILFLDSQVRVADITDGASSTLLVGERPPSWIWVSAGGTAATG